MRAREGYDDHDHGLRWAALRFPAPGAAPRARQKGGPRRRRGAASHEEKEEKEQAAARRGADGTSRQQAGVAFSSPLLAQWFRTSARSYAAMEVDRNSLFGGAAGGVPGLPADRDLLQSLDRVHGVSPGEVDPAMHQLHVLRAPPSRGASPNARPWRWIIKSTGRQSRSRRPRRRRSGSWACR